jgi:hypothetical protein
MIRYVVGLYRSLAHFEVPVAVEKLNVPRRVPMENRFGSEQSSIHMPSNHPHNESLPTPFIISENVLKT